MKRIIIGAALAASLLSTQALAKDASTNGFVGLEIGSTSYDLKGVNQTTGVSASADDTGGSQSLKAGKYLGDAGRVYAVIGRVNADGADLQNYGIAYDYLIYNSSPITPFIGATVGYQSIDIDNSVVDLSGLTYGLELGLLYEINQKFELELGYRHNFHSTDDTVVVSGQSLKFTSEKVSAWYIGANYKF